jgi:hypothetical protein
MDTEPPQLRRALPSVEHFVSCHPDSRLHECGRILINFVLKYIVYPHAGRPRRRARALARDVP